MKRAGRVFEQAISFGVLHDAAYRALCANRENGAALRFMYDLEPELLALQPELESAGSLVAHIAHANTMTLRRTWFAGS